MLAMVVVMLVVVVVVNRRYQQSNKKAISLFPPLQICLDFGPLFFFFLPGIFIRIPLQSLNYHFPEIIATGPIRKEES